MLCYVSDATSHCQRVSLIVTTPVVSDAAAVAIHILVRDCSSCVTRELDSTASFEYQLSVPTIEPGYPSPGAGSVLGNYFITVNVRYLVMYGVLPPFFDADFVVSETGAIITQRTGAPAFSNTDPLVTYFLLRVPRGAEGTTVVHLRQPDSNTTAVSFEFIYLPDTAATISLVDPPEISALGGLTVQLLTAHLTNVSIGMEMLIMFGNQSLSGTYALSGTQQIVQFVAPFTAMASQKTTSVQLTHQDTVLDTQVAHLALPQVDYIECTGSSSCTGTAGALTTVDVWLADIPLRCDYRPDGCTTSAYLADCSGTCSDMVADFGVHGYGVVTRIERVDSLTLVRVVSPTFLVGSLGVVTVLLQVHTDTRFSMNFDIPVEAADHPTLVGDYSNIYLLTTGSQQVNVQVTHLQVTQPSELVVTFAGIQIAISDFSINSAMSQISFNFLSAALPASKAGSAVQAVVTKVDSQLSVAFSVFIEAAPVPTFDSASPPFIILSDQQEVHAVSILVSTLMSYEATAIEVNFTTATQLVYAQNVIASRPSSNSNRLQLDLTLPADTAAGSWDVSISFTAISAPQHIFTYLIQNPVPQVLSIHPGAAKTSETLVLSTRYLGLSSTSISSVQVKFTTQAGSVHTALITALSDETVTVQVPGIGQMNDINSIDVAIIAPVGTASLERAFDWKAPLMPTPLRISPTYGLEHGGFEIALAAEGFVSQTTAELTANDFSVSFGETRITNFALSLTSAASELSGGIHAITFTAPGGLTKGSSQIHVGLVAEAYKNVSYDIRIDDAGEPYLSGMLHPSHCYTQGGGTVSATIKNYPPNTNISAVVNWAGATNVTAQSIITGISGMTNDMQVTFAIPEASQSTSHTQIVSILFTSAVPSISVSSEFAYRAMPTPTVHMNVSKAAYSGGTYILLTLRNLGPRSANSKLIVLFATQYKATVVSTVCKSSTSACDNGLVECAVVVITPQMTSFGEMGNVLVQAYWSDLGMGRAASSEELEIFNPVLPSASSIMPEEGYITENTHVSILNLPYPSTA